jgi:antitoxin MazE
MQVSRWGNSLAVRLPKSLVDALGLKAGDELDVVAAEGRRIEIAKKDRGERFLRETARYDRPLPEGYKFDREDANRR